MMYSNLSFCSSHLSFSGKKQTLDALLLNECGPTHWSPVLSNELGWLVQGKNNAIESTDTIDFVPYLSVPKDQKVTYASFVCNNCPLKDE